MLTRRAVLTGTAAASIAAIASAHPNAAAGSADGSGFALGFGDLEDGAVAGFNKSADGFSVFLKWAASGAEVFYKDTPSGRVEVFHKAFFKGWTPVTSFFLKELGSLEGAEAAFHKVDPHGAEFFIKGEHQIGVVTTFETSAEGVRIDVEEILLNGD